jgi:hypothetical protein
MFRETDCMLKQPQHKGFGFGKKRGLSRHLFLNLLEHFAPQTSGIPMPDMT